MRNHSWCEKPFSVVNLWVPWLRRYIRSFITIQQNQHERKCWSHAVACSFLRSCMSWHIQRTRKTSLIRSDQIYTSSSCGATIKCIWSHVLCSFSYILVWLLRKIPGSVPVKCSTVFTSWSLPGQGALVGFLKGHIKKHISTFLIQ